MGSSHFFPNFPKFHFPKFGKLSQNLGKFGKFSQIFGGPILEPPNHPKRGDITFWENLGKSSCTKNLSHFPNFPNFPKIGKIEISTGTAKQYTGMSCHCTYCEAGCLGGRPRRPGAFVSDDTACGMCGKTLKPADAPN